MTELKRDLKRHAGGEDSSEFELKGKVTHRDGLTSAEIWEESTEKKEKKKNKKKTTTKDHTSCNVAGKNDRAKASIDPDSTDTEGSTTKSTTESMPDFMQRAITMKNDGASTEDIVDKWFERGPGKADEDFGGWGAGVPAAHRKGHHPKSASEKRKGSSDAKQLAGKKRKGSSDTKQSTEVSKAVTSEPVVDQKDLGERLCLLKENSQKLSDTINAKVDAKVKAAVDVKFHEVLAKWEQCCSNLCSNLSSKVFVNSSMCSSNLSAQEALGFLSHSQPRHAGSS